MLLIHRHEQLEGAEAHEAVRYSLFDCKISFPYSFLQQAYLSGVRSEYFKFQGVAAAYSLPRVLSLVGLITFFSQWFVLIWENNPHICAIPLIFLILGLFLSLQQITTTSEATIMRNLSSQTAKLVSMFRDTSQSTENKDSVV